jgi:uncharacterized protein YabN with tetrapyrrole methylase and pyrophosphatase domain
VGAELLALDELVHTLRVQCPWDREQTHGSLARHLLEESYEVLEAIDTVAALDALDTASAVNTAASVTERAVAHLEEELGDLLFQIYFHAVLGAEQGRFNLADVARGVHDKLVARHPHVFGDGTAVTPGDLASSWEALKMAEKKRSTVTEGIPLALPALAMAAKLQRKARAIGMELPGVSDDIARLTSGMARLVSSGGDAGISPDNRSGSDPRGPNAEGDGQLLVADGRDVDAETDNTEVIGENDNTKVIGENDNTEAMGELLFAMVNVARLLGVEPETALRARSAKFRAAIDERGWDGSEHTGTD